MFKKLLHPFYCFIIFVLTFAARSPLQAQDSGPDTVITGVYINSIHDINFKEKEYTVSLWLWLKYKNRKFDFMQNLEVPQAKSVTKSFSTIDSSGEQIYMLMKLQCVMKDAWVIDNFPFDKQRLRFAIENSQFDSRSLLFTCDTFGKHFDQRFTLRGWRIDSLNISAGTKIYETGFGDPALNAPRSEYSTYKVKLQIDRDAFGLFWRLFLGMYLAFLIAYISFFIHYDSIDSRFGLTVGALFAVVGNKYIVDSALPESNTFTLVDTLHGITLFFILLVMVSTAYTLHLVKQEKFEQSRRFDLIFGQSLMALYLLLNCYFIFTAIKGS